MLVNSLKAYFVQLVSTVICASLGPWPNCAVEFAVAVVWTSWTVSKLYLFCVKMGTNKIYLFVLLLASLSASCTSDCPTPEPFLEPPYHKCAKLYSMLERALLANPENLYKLQSCFFPSSSSEPIYVQVTFALNKRFHHTCWTSSVLLKSVDPTVLSFLQLELLNVLLATEDTSANLFTVSLYNEVDVSFNLMVNSTLSDYSPKIINAVLQELTSWVSILEY